MITIIMIMECDERIDKHGRFSQEDPAKSGLESKWLVNIEGAFSLGAVYFLSAAFSESRLRGSWFVGSWYEQTTVEVNIQERQEEPQKCTSKGI